MKNKGISASIAAVLLLVGIVAFGGIAYMYLNYVALAGKPLAAIYDGEFNDAFLATNGNFPTSFSEQTNCNVTSDILGGAWENCVYRSITALNATASVAMNDHDLVLPLVLDIDGAVGPDTKIDIDTGAGTATTGVAADDVPLVGVKLYTHEDNPVPVLDLSGGIEDQEDLDNYKVGYLAGGEYVLEIKWHTSTISPAFTTGDDIARITVDLQTTGDADTAQITVESA